jgi:hypothetical protein
MVVEWVERGIKTVANLEALLAGLFTVTLVLPAAEKMVASQAVQYASWKLTHLNITVVTSIEIAAT